MKRWDTVAVIGVGLIGGSIGLASRQRGLVRRVIGIGRHAERLERAAELGAVTEWTTQMEHGVAQADLVVVCTPVELIVEQVCRVAEACPAGAIITDVGSTKLQIVSELDRRLRDAARRKVGFVGSHPMAGSERSGVEYSQADLFENRVTVVTPSKNTCTRKRQAIEQFWRSLGSRVLRRSPADHDRAVAAVSHLPHLVASALAAATPANGRPLVGGGWRDTTRVAAGDVELWRQILWENRDHVLNSLHRFEKVLASFHDALLRDDPARLVELLTAGKQNRDAVGN